MTPRNLLHAPDLHQLFPEARFINVIRDGRDVAASLISLNWMPGPFEALDWWAARMRQGDKALASLPADRVHHVSFERLLITELV